ncbi:MULTISPECIES: hypothetical protein [Bacteroidales]|uniref:Uncharacterized protein n=1 Tax=Parabacteroides distasonis TaxID=823 RepID=A0A3L7ZNA7_PARDI|nr:MULTISPECIES: hypothetical protein [Bacteroidales]NBH90339.1 hypothetical protein [Parabacteroides distasonis]RLT73316.1 hypothetical protein D7V78_10485 [Parabacteroides distasonis]
MMNNRGIPPPPKQLKMIHTLLSKFGLAGQKENIVLGFSDGRTDSCRDLTMTEAKQLINYLLHTDEKKRMIKSIWHLAYKMGIIYGDSFEDNKMNAATLNLFCKSRGTVKKDIDKQELSELKKTHRQFEGMYKSYLNKQNKTEKIRFLSEKLQVALVTENFEICSLIQSELNKLTKQKRKKI